ncbi:MAG: hypothetical protein Q9219_006292 [cf. Caloplaca sp. 3 TL-2023]
MDNPSRKTQATVTQPKSIHTRRDAKGDMLKEKKTKSRESFPSTADPRPSPQSSAALRETIANARAARRAAPKYVGDEVAKPVYSSFDAAGSGSEDGMHVNSLRKRINSARSDGNLKICNMKLSKFPAEVLKMYDPDTMADGPAWYESVDLVRLDASNNDLDDLDWECLDERVEDADHQQHGNIFSSLQFLDLHGNKLHALPSTLRNLGSLTILNLSRNCLGHSTSEVFDVISDIPSLRELYLAENGFSGLCPSLSQCSKLEILDLHSNGFTDLPAGLSECKALRRLDVSVNKISRTPPGDLPNLAVFNISMNPIDIDDILTNLAASKLTDLDISTCRIEFLPALKSRYPNLTSVTANENRISTIDVESLKGLEVLDLRRNDLRSLPPELSLLGLKKFMAGGNPMRVPRREILEGTTDRLMEWLRGRLPSEEDDY